MDKPKTLPHVEHFTQAKFSAGFWLAAGIVFLVIAIWFAAIYA